MRLTAKQDETLEFVQQHVREHGLPPTRAEIARRFGINVNAAQDRLLGLQRKGFIRLVRVQRGIQLVAP